MAVPRSSRRMVSCATAAVLIISGTAVALTLYAPEASASGTVLFNQPFHDNSVDGSAGSVALPTTQAGINNACLTAAGNATANPLASCSTATGPQGSGALRFTPDTGGSPIGGPTLNFPAPPAGFTHTVYSDTLTESGVRPFTWSVSSGALPPGISLTGGGILTGTPTATGTFGFTVKVTDEISETAAAVTPAAASGSVTFSDLLSTGPQSGQVVTLGAAVLSGGTAALTVDLPAFNTNTVTATYGGDSSYASAVSGSAGVQVNAYAGEVIINQFRLSGPGGAGDQCAELYNAGPAVSLAGFSLAASSGASVTVPSSAPVLASRGTYLITGAGYSLSTVAVPDLSAPSLGTAGLQVIAPDGPGTVTDAAGSAGALSGFYAGTALPALSGTPADQYAWVRLEKAVTIAEIRITSLSEVNGPPEPGVTDQSPTPAQLRVINPAAPTSQVTITGGKLVTVQNLSVDAPSTAVSGGGLDTTLTIPLSGGSLAPGAPVSIAVSFAVDWHGPYWYGYNVDALAAPASAPDHAPARHSRTYQPAAPPSQLLHAGTPDRYATGHGVLP